MVWLIESLMIENLRNKWTDKLFEMLILADLLSVINKQDVFPQEYLKFINLLYL